MSDKEETAVAEKAAEFHSDEQRESYLSALEHERAGYLARVERAKRSRQEHLSAEELQDRVAQVDEEIARVGGAKKTSGRGAKKDAGAAEA